MHADKWALKAKQEGYKTRAVYKLEEILSKTNSFKSAHKILDIGSAPGGWSHYLRSKLPDSKIFAIDGEYAVKQLIGFEKLLCKIFIFFIFKFQLNFIEN